MTLDNTEVYVYKETLIEIRWCPYILIYHWTVFVDGHKRGDSSKGGGYDTLEMALIYAKRHADWVDCDWSLD